MKQLQTKAKDILQKSTWVWIGTLIFLMGSCKSGKATIDLPTDSTGVQSNELTEVNTDQFDTLKLLELIQEKERLVNSYRGAFTRTFDLLHTELDLDFDYQNQTVLGHAVLEMSPLNKPQKKVDLNAQDFEVGKVYFINEGDSASVGYAYDGQILTISFPKEVTIQDTFQLSIKYTAFPNKNSGNGSQAITDTKGLYFIDPLGEDPLKSTMIWTQGETEHNSKWFPTFDYPNEKMTQLLKLTVPDSMVSVGNGELVKQVDLGNGFHKDFWEMKLPHSPYLTAFAIGNFVRVEDEYEDIPLGYYVEKGYEEGAKIVFKNTPEMVGYFSELLGVDYPWPKYDQVVVKDFVSGAMENTTVSIFMEELQLDEREAIDAEWDYIIAHELFHHWFGDFVTTESWGNLPLNEGFANYSEFLWNEYKYGPDQAALKLVAEMETYFQEAESKQVDLIRYYYQDSEDMFDAHSYSKAGVILHMLRQYLGDEVFFTSLKKYLKDFAFSTVEVHDLRMAFESVSGEDLNWFFNQWFLDKGHPELYVEVDYSIPENILISITQIQDLNEAPLYKIPFEISWYEEGLRKSKQFILKEAFQQFALENDTPLDLVFFDEEKDLLAIKNQTVSSEHWVRQYEISEKGIARYEALDSLSAGQAYDELRLLMPYAIRDDFWSIREQALGILQGHPEWMEENPELEAMVMEIARTGERNSVRAGALDALAAYDALAYEDLFMDLVKEPSVLVSSSALMGLTGMEGKTLDPSIVNTFSEENNFRYVVPMAEYFITKPISGKGDWFHEKAKRLSGEGLYYYLGYYGEYFSRFPEEGKEEAVKFLLNMMQNEGQSYLRLGAFQALLGFSDEAAVVDEISKVAAEETDLDLINYYNYFMEALKDEN